MSAHCPRGRAAVKVGTGDRVNQQRSRVPHSATESSGEARWCEFRKPQFALPCPGPLGSTTNMFTRSHSIVLDSTDYLLAAGLEVELRPTNCEQLLTASPAIALLAAAVAAAAASAVGFRISTGAKHAAAASAASFSSSKAVQEGEGAGSPSSFEWHSSGRKCNVPLNVIDLITLLSSGRPVEKRASYA